MSSVPEKVSAPRAAPASPEARAGPASSGPRAARWWLLLAPAVLVGAWLRLDQIGLQVIADDERHAVNYLLEHSFADVFLHFGVADYCVPLTLYDQLVAKTVGLTEVAMRAPALLAGIAALVLLPWMLRPAFGGKTSLVFAWLLASSPLHVYFSRYARPYSIVFLLVFAGAVACLRWREGASRRWLWAWAACAALAPWFHLAVLPLALGPLVLDLASTAARRGDLAARAREVAAPVLATALGLLALVGPPLVADLETLRGRSGTAWFTAEGLLGAYERFSGASAQLVAFAFGVACLAGLVALSRHRPRWLATFVFLAACELAALAVSRPDVVDAPIVLARYGLPLLGFVLLIAAEGLARLDGALRREWRRLPPHAISAGVAASVLAFGPLLSLHDPENAVHYRPNSFTNHALYQYQHTARARRNYVAELGPPRVSPFYVEVGRRAPKPHDPERIVESPWINEWARAPFVLYQRVHRRPVSAGFLASALGPRPEGELPASDPRLRFANFVHHEDDEALRAQGVRWWVLHKDLAAELRLASGSLPAIDPAIARVRLEKRFGAPCFEDQDLVVFDLRPETP